MIIGQQLANLLDKQLEKKKPILENDSPTLGVFLKTRLLVIN